MCPEGLQPCLDALVAAVDLLGVVDGGFALRDQRGDQQRHAGADVRAGDGLAVKLAGPMTTARWGSQMMTRAPMEIRRSTQTRRLSYIHSWMSDVPRAWVASTSAIEVRSAGKPGQGARGCAGRRRAGLPAPRALGRRGTKMSSPRTSKRTPSLPYADGGHPVLLGARVLRISTLAAA